MPFDIDAYLATRPEKHRATTRQLYDFVQERAEGLEPKEHGHGIIGWGDGEDGWFLVGLCARAGGAMLYPSARELDRYDDVLRSKRTGITCLKLTRWGSVDEAVLDDLVRSSLGKTTREYAGKAYADKADAATELTDVDQWLAGKPDKHLPTARHLLGLIEEVSGGAPAQAYDDNILGFGRREDGWFKVCLGVRNGGCTLYTTSAALDAQGDVLKKSHRTGQGCLKVPKLSTFDDATLRDILQRSW